MGNIQHNIYQNLTVKDLANPQTVVRAYKEAESKELQIMKDHRSKKDKKAKDPTEEDPDNENDSKMKDGEELLFECELCTTPFYPSHVPLPRPLQAAIFSSKGKSQEPIENQSQSPQSLRDIKFLCPKCLRSRRPRLETILSLLVALNKLSVRLPEGEALQCLTERAMAWRDRAQKALNEKDVADALKTLSEQNKYDSSTAASNNKPNHKKGKSVKKSDNDDDADSSTVLDTSITDSENGLEVDDPNKSADDADHSDKDAESKSPSCLRPPEVKLSNKSLNTLEALMLEGDLLEVSMDETQHIWRVLQATEPRGSKRYPDLDRLEEQLENDREEKIKAKKKRKLELAEAQKAKNQENESNEPKSKKAKEDKSSPRKSHDASNKKQQTKRKRKNSESSEQEEEQEDCSASPKCLRPTGKEVHWVQCDVCELWLHLHCIGLKPEQVSEDEDFICKTCKPNRQNQRKKKAND